MNRFLRMYSGDYAKTALDAIVEREDVSRFTARALYRRGIRTPAEAEGFLHPSAAQLCDPFLLPDMEQAVSRIRRAAESGEKVCVYGDYDADGICASAIMQNALELAGANADCYIPSRKKEGYGLNEAAVRRLHAEGVRLIVTVDNGINACREAEVCKELGVDLVVTDHHSADARMPVCAAVVAATRPDSVYPNAKLSGAGVACKLSQALLPTMDHADDLALAAVATVADVMPLTPENRAIVSLGMLHVPDNIGLCALLQAAGWSGGEVTEQMLAFLIAPRLNASGRVGNAMSGVRLLRSESREAAAETARLLDADNAARKEIEAGILAEAKAKLGEAGGPTRRGVVLCGAGWNLGVIGIVASRLCDMTHLPVLLFAEHDGVVTGSGRSPEGVDLFQLLSRFSHLFLRYGGHARAAGVTMEADLLPAFTEAFLDALDEYDPDCFVPSYRYEEETVLRDLTVETVDELRRLAPFGEGNPEPVFLLKNASVRNVRAMGKDGAHLSAAVAMDGAVRRLVAFRCGTLRETLLQRREWELLVKPAVNRYMDREDVELNFVACEENVGFAKVFDAFFADTMYNEMYADSKLAEWVLSARPFLSEQPTRERYCGLYKDWCAVLAAGEITADRLTALCGPDMLMAFAVFYELGFFVRDEAADTLKRSDGRGVRELTESRLYRLLTAEQ